MIDLLSETDMLLMLEDRKENCITHDEKVEERSESGNTREESEFSHVTIWWMRRNNIGMKN
jgi:hypothetical protein